MEAIASGRIDSNEGIDGCSRHERTDMGWMPPGEWV